MGRAPCDKKGLKKGPWTPEEDEKLVQHIKKHGQGSWRSLPKLAGLIRCGKSCRLRWTNYLRPDIKRGPFSTQEENLVIQLHGILGNRWAAIASQLQGRTDNEIKNLWNTHLKKRLLHMGVHKPSSPSPSPSTTCHVAQGDYFLRLWNSEVGETFRKEKKGACFGQTTSSSTTKCSSLSEMTVKMEAEFKNSKSDLNEIMDSSESALELLLDFTSNNDMSFLDQPDCCGLYSSIFF